MCRGHDRGYSLAGGRRLGVAAVLGRDNPEYQHTEQPQEMVEVRVTQEQQQEMGAGTRGAQEQEDMDRVRTVQQWPPPVE